MEGLIQQLRNTPIPIILIWVGIVFLLIPFLSKIGGTIEIRQGNKRFAFFIGAALLALGIVLNYSHLTVPAIEEKAKLSAPEEFLRELLSSSQQERLWGWLESTDRELQEVFG